MPHKGHHTELQALQVEVLGAMCAAGDKTTQTMSPPRRWGPHHNPLWSKVSTRCPPPSLHAWERTLQIHPQQQGPGFPSPEARSQNWAPMQEAPAPP